MRTIFRQLYSALRKSKSNGGKVFNSWAGGGSKILNLTLFLDMICPKIPMWNCLFESIEIRSWKPVVRSWLNGMLCFCFGKDSESEPWQRAKKLQCCSPLEGKKTGRSIFSTVLCALKPFTHQKNCWQPPKQHLAKYPQKEREFRRVGASP